MGSQFPTTAFKSSAAASQPPEMALSYADIVKIFQLKNSDLYDDPRKNNISYLSPFVNALMRKASIPHKNPEIKEITTKINADRDFIVVACYTTPDTEAKEHFVLFIGTFHQGSAKNNEDIAFYLDLHYAFSVDMRQDKILENFIAIWKKTHDNGSHSYYKTDTVDDFYSSLCYANELFVRIITGQSLDNSAIESAQAWFQRNLWERQVQIGICLDRQPNAIFNAGAEILYRQQMGNRPQDIYSPPEQKQ